MHSVKNINLCPDEDKATIFNIQYLIISILLTALLLIKHKSKTLLISFILISAFKFDIVFVSKYGKHLFLS